MFPCVLRAGNSPWLAGCILSVCKTTHSTFRSQLKNSERRRPSRAGARTEKYFRNVSRRLSIERESLVLANLKEIADLIGADFLMGADFLCRSKQIGGRVKKTCRCKTTRIGVEIGNSKSAFPRNGTQVGTEID